MPAPTIEIRLAREAELSAVGDLTVAAYLLDGHVQPDDDYVHRLRDAAARAAEAQLWVAVEDGQVLGTVTMCPVGSPWREIALPDEGEFRTLAVAPVARGRGVGELLVRACITRSRLAGDRALVLSTIPIQVTAHRLYGRLGFERFPERDWSPVPGVQLLAYQLRHSGGDSDAR
jgi:predicted N-acetyltransferase YhbS